MSAATLSDNIPTATTIHICRFIRRYVRSYIKSPRAIQPWSAELAKQRRNTAERTQQALVANLSAMR